MEDQLLPSFYALRSLLEKAYPSCGDGNVAGSDSVYPFNLILIHEHAPIGFNGN